MIKVLQKGGAYMTDSDWTLFLIDEQADIEKLPTSIAGTKELNPCATGSVAMSSDGATVAMLGNDNVWHIWA